MKKLFKTTAVLSLLATLALLILSQPVETLDIDELRIATPGLSLADLPDGVTNYVLEGTGAGPLILLIHGGREPLWTWDEVVPALHEAGMRTLRYDMFGRGFSDRPPKAAYDREFYLKQAEDLLDVLEINEPVHVAAYSFGATIAAKLSNARPHQVKSLTVLAPRYYAMTLPAIVRVPLLNDVLIDKMVKPQALEEVQGFFRSAVLRQRYAGRVGKPEGVIGNHVAFRAFALSDALGGTSEIYQELSKTSVPILIISGGIDVGIPPQHIAGIVSHIPNATQLVYPEADHGLVWEKGGEIAHELVEFIGGR